MNHDIVFHNPVLARESLTKSVEKSHKGIKLANDFPEVS